MFGYRRYDQRPFEELVGKTLASVTNEGDEIIRFTVDDGAVYELYHDQDCCENVSVDDVCGSLDDLVGAPIFVAEEVTNADEPPRDPSDAEWGSYTWTFYKLATIKGSVTIRWYGSSNGYYSEAVSFGRVKQDA